MTMVMMLRRSMRNKAKSNNGENPLVSTTQAQTVTLAHCQRHDVLAALPSSTSINTLLRCARVTSFPILRFGRIASTFSFLLSLSASLDMSNLTPPQPPPTWQHKPDEVLELSKKTIDHTKEVYGELATAEAEIQVLDPVHFYWSVSTSKELRNASNQTDTLIRNFLVECEMRVDVFIAKKNADANIESQGVNLSAEERRLGEKMKLDGKRAGLDLPEGKRKVLELNRLCVGFSLVYTEPVPSGDVLLTVEDLDLFLLVGYSRICYFYNNPDHAGANADAERISNFAFAVMTLCLFFAGAGGNGGFTSTVYASAKSCPDMMRASAMRLVISGFGLSAFFFSGLARILYPDDTSSFPLVLAFGTPCPMIPGLFFVRTIPLPSDSDDSPDSTPTPVPCQTTLPATHRHAYHHQHRSNQDDEYAHQNLGSPAPRRHSVEYAVPSPPGGQRVQISVKIDDVLDSGDIAQQITAIFRRVLPAIRIASKAFWNGCVSFLTSLNVSFPRARLPELKSPLDEDVELSGFSPIQRNLFVRPPLKADELASEARVAHPNEEYLMRISDILKKAEQIATIEFTLSGQPSAANEPARVATPVVAAPRSPSEPIQPTRDDPENGEDNDDITQTLRTDDEVLRDTFDEALKGVADVGSDFDEEEVEKIAAAF
ncbi:uncharacterized protein FOMMEDRAFT_165668 [Fomitiporia mediterranea MF3/22]|uniref:uncharacterized protein n=1 Tax=Fomitiporia mediterranea (strain MF3/22) TaxID=694068 RepID=UPI0004408B8B|nr:uncharacterized protein FOMMEDRAFT_165668 [Fomitiporia mediterranea MF3/22]EJD07040.1 hypothetical protein FOMMEDRAFT_165668 [Fomitiporia mediterranea MF3/22]